MIDFLKVVRLVFWSGVVGPELSLARALRSYDRASRSKARLVSKSTIMTVYKVLNFSFGIQSLRKRKQTMIYRFNQSLLLPNLSL